jgi:hypothetical protein
MPNDADLPYKKGALIIQGFTGDSKYAPPFKAESPLYKHFDNQYLIPPLSQGAYHVQEFTQ